MTTDYLASARKQFAYYKSLAEKTFSQLADQDLIWQHNPETNSIATIVKHLHGNMLSRWTDFLSSDGEKEWRSRDAEFMNDLSQRKQVIALWNAGWECLFNTLDSLQPTDLSKEIQIRAQTYSAMDAINRQLAHYAYHVGQIVFIGKMLCNDRWVSLTIPRGKSAQYNAEKFGSKKEE